MWYQSVKIIRTAQITPDNKLFHGTIENIKGPLRGGGYDDILWHADNSAIAQSYIPKAGLINTLPRNWKSDIIRPTDDIYQTLAKQIGHGFAYDIETDEYNRPQSWRIHGDKITQQDIWDYLEQELGYKPDHNQFYRLLSNYNPDTKNYEIHPASYKAPGQLYIGTPKEELNFKDFRNFSNDLFEPQYHKRNWFEKANDEGYDGVIIKDYLQSDNWGNVEHDSWGLLPRGIGKMKYDNIPATNFDWEDDIRVKDSPEYSAWKQ